MLVMLVVDVAVRMVERLMRVFVAVALRQMQPGAERHEHAGDEERHGERLAEDDGGAKRPR